MLHHAETDGRLSVIPDRRPFIGGAEAHFRDVAETDDVVLALCDDDGAEFLRRRQLSSCSHGKLPFRPLDPPPGDLGVLAPYGRLDILCRQVV